MKDLFKLILGVLASLLKSRARLEAEILILRHREKVGPRQHRQVSPNECLPGGRVQIFSVTIFGKMPMPQALSETRTTFGENAIGSQLNLFSF